MKALLLIFFLSLPTLAQVHYRFTALSKKYDIQLTSERADDTTWRGKTKVALFLKGAVRPFQVIHLHDTQITIDADGKPEIASVADKKNGKWSSVYLEDFDFDGFEDLAVADGDNGGYRGTSYRIYLFDRNRSRFGFSQPFTRLAQGPYIGIPETNKKDRTLYVFWKSSCCMHFEETYLVTGSRPKLVMKRSEYDDVHGDGYSDIETRKLIRGKWRTWNKREKIESK